MFVIEISYNDVKMLKVLHSNIKTLKFIHKNPFPSVELAYQAAIDYINEFYKKCAYKTEPLVRLAVTPKRKSEWNELSLNCDVFTTEEPFLWKLTCWKKQQNKGYFFSSFNFEELFTLSILQTHEISSESVNNELFGDI